MDSPGIHHGFSVPVAEADDMAFAWATAKSNELVLRVLLRLATTRVRYRGLCRIGGDDSLAPSTCREIL